MLKKRALILFSVILILMASIFSFAETQVPKPTKDFYVADYGGVLTNDVESFIVGTNLNYEKTREKPQIVVATVPDMQGMDVVSYGVKLFEEWKIGNKELDNGVLILLALKERKIRIEVGYGLEGAIPDGKAGEILDSALPNLREGKYSEGLLQIFYQVAHEVNKEYGYDDEVIFSSFEGVNVNPNAQVTDGGIFSSVGKVIFVLLIMLLIWFDNRFLGGFLLNMFLRMLFFGRGGGGFGGGSFGGGGSSGGGGSDRGF